MRLSLDWLSDYVTWTVKDPQEIARRLTLSVAEVEEVIEQGRFLQHCCVGEITAILPHPNASKLQLADVQTDKGTLRVVCGGTNLRLGMQVAFAHVGATVKHGDETMTLTEATIRGEKSNGMLCAAEELDLDEMFPPKPEDGERPIIDLSRDAEVKTGEDLRKALGQTDVIFDVNNTAITNRPDLFSHIGFARECVAAGLAKWKKEPSFPMPKFPKTAPPFKFILEAKQTVPHYLGCVIDIGGMGETPEWMRRRLIATGFRPLLLPIDITNYVAHDVGMPLHSFDLDDIQGDIRCRLTKEGEKIVTLDEVERKLPEGALVLSDDKGVFDLLGIMGGLRSSTKESTRRVYLHSATIDPSVIRRTIMATGHRTDASTTYEKGVPVITSYWGFARALQLFTELVPGATIASSAHALGKDKPSAAISLRADRPSQVLGTNVPAGDAKNVLTAIGCTVKTGKEKWSVTPPAWRAKDLKTEEDLIDEIGRLRGYDKIEDKLPAAPVQIPPRDHRGRNARTLLMADGYQEILPLSLLSPALVSASGMDPNGCRRVQNPLSEDFSILQPSTLPGLLEHANRSMLSVSKTLRTFRLCTVFGKKEEHQELGMLLAAREKTGLLDDPFLELKTSLLDLLSSLGYQAHVQEKQADHPWMHPGRTAAVFIGETDIGTISEVHPDIRARFDLPGRTAAGLLSWSLLLSIDPKTRHAHSGSLFPAVTYDTTVARSQRDAVGPLLAMLRSAHPLLEEVVVQDLYQPPREENYRLTLRCVYRAKDRTLTEEEAKKAHEEVLKKGNLAPVA